MIGIKSHFISFYNRLKYLNLGLNILKYAKMYHFKIIKIFILYIKYYFYYNYYQKKLSKSANSTNKQFYL